MFASRIVTLQVPEPRLRDKASLQSLATGLPEIWSIQVNTGWHF